jgi:hypothetical protein
MQTFKMMSLPKKSAFDLKAKLGFEVNKGNQHAATFCLGSHPDPGMRDADYVLTTPASNDSDCIRKDGDVRRQTAKSPILNL